MKRLFALLMSAALLLGLGACGGQHFVFNIVAKDIITGENFTANIRGYKAEIGGCHTIFEQSLDLGEIAQKLQKGSVATTLYDNAVLFTENTDSSMRCFVIQKLAEEAPSSNNRYICYAPTVRLQNEYVYFPLYLLSDPNMQFCTDQDPMSPNTAYRVRTSIDGFLRFYQNYTDCVVEQTNSELLIHNENDDFSLSIGFGMMDGIADTVMINLQPTIIS